MTENIIHQGSEKVLVLRKNDMFEVSCLTDFVLLEESIYQKRYLAKLNGHIIHDTKYVDKLDNWDYELKEPIYATWENKAQPFNIVKANREN